MRVIDRALKGKLVSAMRKLWQYYSEERAAVLMAAEVMQTNPETGRTRKHWKCAECSAVTLKVHVDHIAPIGTQPATFHEVGTWLDRLFCDWTNLQVLCDRCHKEKTARERRNKELAK